MRRTVMILAFALALPAGSALASSGKKFARGTTLTTESIASAPETGWAFPSPLRLGINHPFPAYGNSVPTCDNASVLGTISSRFSSAESNAGRGLQIQEFRGRQRQRAANNWGYNNIPRRVCEARALFSDHRVRTVNYVIREGQGMIGMTYGVDWCVQGVDRFWIYTPDCRSLKN